VQDGKIKITHVMFENGREYQSPNKVLPVAVIGQTRIGESIIVGNLSIF
jgi:hypothetical protein